MKKSEVLKRLRTGERLRVGFRNGKDNSDGFCYLFEHWRHQPHTRIYERTMNALEKAGLVTSQPDVDYDEETGVARGIRYYLVATSPKENKEH